MCLYNQLKLKSFCCCCVVQLGNLLSCVKFFRVKFCFVREFMKDLAESCKDFFFLILFNCF